LELKNPRAWNGLGMSYWVLARQQFEWIETNALFSPEWYALVARSQLQQQQYQRAFGHFRKAESGGRALPGVHAGLAEVYRNTGHADWASIEENRESAAKFQDAPEVTAHYLQALSNQQRAAEALAHLQTLPPSAELHNLLGFAYRAQHRDTESAVEFQRALEFDPENAAFMKEWATSLWLAGDCAHAEPILTKLLQRTPNSPALNHMMGDCLVSNERDGEALPFLRAALATDPSFLPAHASLGRALLHLGRYTEAISHLRRAAPLRDKQILYQLAQAYRKAGDEANATRYLEEYRRYQSGEEPLEQARLGSDITGP
jgi:Flp pilus assembly protein TadD